MTDPLPYAYEKAREEAGESTPAGLRAMREGLLLLVGAGFPRADEALRAVEDEMRERGEPVQ